MATEILAPGYLIWGALSLGAVLWEHLKYGRSPFKKPVLQGSLTLLLAVCLLGGLSSQQGRPNAWLVGIIGLALGALSGIIAIVLSFRK